MGTASVATEESKPLRSRYQLQSVIQSTLLDGCTLTKPRTVQAVVLAAGLFLVVDELRDRAQQSPGGILGSMHFCTTAMALIEHLHFLERSLIGQAHRQIGVTVGLWSSAGLNISTGLSIVLCMSLLFAVTFCVMKMKKVA